MAISQFEVAMKLQDPATQATEAVAAPKSDMAGDAPHTLNGGY